jgi:hypothetical protein
VPAGRMASWASCAPLLFVVYWRGRSLRYSFPYRSSTLRRAAPMASPERCTESVRM